MSEQYCYILEGQNHYEPAFIIDIYADKAKAEERAEKLRKRKVKYQRQWEKYYGEPYDESKKEVVVPRYNYDFFEVIKHKIIQ